MKTSLKKAAKTLEKLVRKPEEPELRPTIDFPRQDERIETRHYSVRVTVAEQADQVDVSIDQGPWQACRLASGHWWFDLQEIPKGERAVIARARQGEGRWMVSLPIGFLAD